MGTFKKKMKHKIPWAHILMTCAVHAYAGYKLCRHKCTDYNHLQ
jgi:hypothetical protein